MSAATAIPEYVQAAQGDPHAHMALMRAALAGAAAGAIHQREGYAVAELFGRFALALGHQPALEQLVGVLFDRCNYEHEVDDGDHMRGCAAAAQALRYLDLAADLGDERAASTIANLTRALPAGAAEMVTAWQAPDMRDFHRNSDMLFARAAAGDINAGIAIFQQIRVEAERGMLTELETLALAENVTRIGAASGDPRMHFALAGVMLLRHRHAVAHGVTNGLDYIGALSVSLLADLTAAEFPGARAELQDALAYVEDRVALHVARTHPIILTALDPKGGC